MSNFGDAYKIVVVKHPICEDKCLGKFGPGQDFAEFSFTRRVNDAAFFQVGLDGVYRYTETDIGIIAAYGNWNSPDTFEVFYQWGATLIPIT
ncbi:hypothetical protein ACFLYO_09055 [Chloroflexota bacterium]